MGSGSSVQSNCHQQIEQVNLNNFEAYSPDKKVSQYIFQYFSIIQAELRPSQISFIMKVLKKHHIFAALEYNFLQMCAKKFKKATGQKGDYLFHQYDPATCFFIIYEGKINIQKNCVFVRQLKAQDSFGEIALTYDTQRTASAKVGQNGLILFYIHQKHFNKILETIRIEEKQNSEKLLSQIPIFDYITNKQKKIIIQNFIKLYFKKKQRVFFQGDIAHSLYLLSQGSLAVHIPGKSKLTIHPKQYFGESVILGASIRQGSVHAQEDSVCYAITQVTIKKVLSTNDHCILYYNIQKWALKRSSALQGISTSSFNRILNSLRIRKANKYQCLFNRLDSPIRIFIPLNCQINEYKDFKIFGEEFLEDSYEESCKHDIIATQEGYYAYGQITQIKHYIKQGRSPRNLKLSHKNTSEQLSLTIKNLVIVKKICGDKISETFLARCEKFCSYYIVKVFQNTRQMIQAVKLERKTLIELDSCVFSVGFYKIQADHQCIYMIKQFIQGACLFDVLREIGLLPPLLCKYYSASIICFLQYLHGKSLIFRNLKPQSIIVSNKGQLKITEVHLSKKLEKQKQYRTSTIVGTPYYMAPEIIGGKGYSFQVDYWALGILMFQFAHGKVPFGVNASSPYEIFEQIKSKKLIFPNSVKNKQIKTLIELLCQKNSLQRSKCKWSDIKKMAYFQGFDWQSLIDEEMEGPYVPKKFRKCSTPIKNAFDNQQLPEFPYNISTLETWDHWDHNGNQFDNF